MTTWARPAGLAGILLFVLAAGCPGSSRVAYKELADKDPAVRANAAARLGEAGAKDAVPSLVAALNDPDEAVRVNVIRALGKIGDASTAPKIAAYVADPLVTVRMAACQALGDLKDPAQVPALEKALYDRSDTMRLVAARALAHIPGPESLDALVRVALQDENERVRAVVVQVVGSRRATDAIPKLESALAAESDLVRANAAQALGEIGDRSSLPALLHALDDPFYKVRSLAAHAIAKIAPDDASARQTLARRLSVETPTMAKVDIAWALATMGDRSHLDVLRTLLVHGDPEDVRAEAAIALGDVGEPSDVNLLEKALSDKKGLVRSSASDAIAKLKGKKADTTS